MTKDEFKKVLAETVLKVCKERGYGYAQYVIAYAQGCCESNYGQSAIMSKANAFFGIKATKSWVNAGKYGGKVYSSKTKECYDGKTLTTITACFRAYNSLDDSVRDYFDLLSNKRYAKSLTASTPEECIKIIHEGGYATSTTYQSTILNFYKKDKGLVDAIWQGVAVLPATEPTEYTIVRGDNLTKIAKKFNTTTWKLVALNKPKYPRMTLNYIQAGWVIKIK